MPVEAMPTVRPHARRAAAYWRNDHGAAIEIDTRLANLLNQIDIDAKVIVQARELFAMFDQLMQSAQSRRVGLIRAGYAGSEGRRIIYDRFGHRLPNGPA